MLKKDTKENQREIRSAVLRAGETVPFNGVLVDVESFKILLKASTKECKCE